MFVVVGFFFTGDNMALYETMLSGKNDNKKVKNPGLGSWYGKCLNGGTRLGYDKVLAFITFLNIHIHIYIYTSSRIVAFTLILFNNLVGIK